MQGEFPSGHGSVSNAWSHLFTAILFKFSSRRRAHCILQHVRCECVLVGLFVLAFALVLCARSRTRGHGRVCTAAAVWLVHRMKVCALSRQQRRACVHTCVFACNACALCGFVYETSQVSLQPSHNTCIASGVSHPFWCSKRSTLGQNAVIHCVPGISVRARMCASTFVFAIALILYSCACACGHGRVRLLSCGLCINWRFVAAEASVRARMHVGLRVWWFHL